MTTKGIIADLEANKAHTIKKFGENSPSVFSLEMSIKSIMAWKKVKKKIISFPDDYCFSKEEILKIINRHIGYKGKQEKEFDENDDDYI